MLASFQQMGPIGRHAGCSLFARGGSEDDDPQDGPPRLRHMYAPQLPAKTLMEYMGITKFSVVQRYINFSKTEKVEQFERATRSIVGVEKTRKGSPSVGEPEALLDQLRPLAPPGREQAWMAFLDGLRAMFGREEKRPDTTVETAES